MSGRSSRSGFWHAVEVKSTVEALAVPPWIPIGVTGVVRRAGWNSAVVTAKAGDALMIPGELFAREWFRPYEPGELANVLADGGG